MKSIMLFFLLLGMFSTTVAQTPEYYYEKGIEVATSEQYEKALQFFKRAIELKPNYWQAYFRKVL